MKPEDFGKTWSKIQEEKAKLLDRRTSLETELVEVRHKLAHLTEVINHLAPLAGLAYTSAQDFSKLGITDAIRSILQNSEERLAAQEVRRLLAEKGYDLSGLSVPMASIYKILHRLVNDSEEVERETEDGRVYYQWKRMGSGPITDEDIPF